MHGLSSLKKDKLLIKKGKCCFYCGRKLNGYWEADHLIPKCRGGGDSYANLVPSCRTCNAMKTYLKVNEFFEKMIKILELHGYTITANAEGTENTELDLDEIDEGIKKLRIL